jgi:L-ornithine Nalpha-acyltransferase
MALALRRALQRGRAFRRLRARKGGPPKIALPFINRRISSGRLIAPRDREIRLTAGSLEVRLIETDEELAAAQKLRYDVFYRERGATPTAEMAALGRDYDQFDSGCDHLIVLDHAAEHAGSVPIVGTYRLLRRDAAAKLGRFYTQDEFSIRRLLKGGSQVLELGRSCLTPEYRKQMPMNLLWRGIGLYAHTHNVNLMFGCASFHGINPADIAVELSYLRHYHLAPLRMRPKARRKRYVNMNWLPPGSYDPKAARAALPPLIKGYLRMGGMIGDGAVIDEQFNTIDVCVVVRPDRLTKAFARQMNFLAQDRPQPS